MARKKMLGFDVTATAIRIAVCENGLPTAFLEERLPENIVRDGQIVSWDAMADFVKETLKTHGIRIKDAAFTIPSSAVYIQHVRLPLMTADQLRVNLPYEFHDYINREMDRYIYDYAVNKLDEETMDLLAVAAPKDLAMKYGVLCHRSGLKLRILTPDVAALRNILREYEAREGIPNGTKDYAILDLGDQSAQLHFFSAGEYEVTRSLDVGCLSIAEGIGSITGIDPHLILLGQTGGLTAEAEQNNELVLDLCNSLAMQVMRALNFYSYNNPNNTLDTLFICGFGTRLAPLMQELQSNVELPMKPLSTIYDPKAAVPEGMDSAPQAYGVAIGKEW